MCIWNGVTNKCASIAYVPVRVCILHMEFMGNNLRNKIKIFYFNGMEAVASSTPKAERRCEVWKRLRSGGQRAKLYDE